MKNMHDEWRLKEPLNPQIKVMVWTGIAAIGVYALVGLVRADPKPDAQRLGAMLLILVVTSVLLLLLLLLTNRAKVVLDEQGARTCSILGRENALEWRQLRTAAAVQLNNRADMYWIILSIHEPKEVISRKRLMWKNAKRGEELHIPCTQRRKAVVEHYLNKKLPMILL